MKRDYLKQRKFKDFRYAVELEDGSSASQWIVYLQDLIIEYKRVYGEFLIDVRIVEDWWGYEDMTLNYQVEYWESEDDFHKRLDKEEQDYKQQLKEKQIKEKVSEQVNSLEEEIAKLIAKKNKLKGEW